MNVMRFAVANLAASLALGLGAPAEAEPFRLIVTDLETPLVPNSVMDLALQLGYFEEEGVDVEFVRVQQTPLALTALQAGEGEMANVSVDAVLQLVLRGNDDLRAVISPNKSLPFLIASRSDIAEPVALAGAAFGVGRVGSLDHSLSMNVLERHGAEVDSIEIVGLGQPAVRAQALAAGQIDATTMSIGVWNSMPDHDGLAVLIDHDAYYAAAPVVNKVNVLTEATLRARPQEVEGVIRALVRISRDFANDADTWVDAMRAARPDVEEATLDLLAEAFRDSWSVNGGLSRDELEYTTTWMFETEDFQGEEPVPLETWVDFGPLDAVLTDLGQIPGFDEPTR
jgi:NitT/TauT family transport system substrate-binding protein